MTRKPQWCPSSSSSCWSRRCRGACSYSYLCALFLFVVAYLIVCVCVACSATAMSRVRHVGEFYESELKEAWVKHEAQLGVADVVYQNCWTGEYSSGVPPDTHVVMTPQQYQLEKVSFGALGTSNALFKKPRIGRRQPSAGASRAARRVLLKCTVAHAHAHGHTQLTLS